MKNLIKTLLACALLICVANAKTLREGTLKVATEGTFSPFSYYNDKNELVGYDVDVARAVAEKLGLKIEFLTAPWDAMLAAFDAGKASHGAVRNSIFRPSFSATARATSTSYPTSSFLSL